MQSPSHAVVRESLEHSFLAEVAPTAAKAVLRQAVVHRLRAGDVFIVQGETQRCGIVIQGLARVFLSLPDGRERTVREVSPGGAVGVAALIGLPNPVNVQAVVDSHVLDLDPDRLVSLASADASLAMALAREATRRAHDTYAVMAGESGPARQRLARRLLDLAAETRDEPAIARVAHAQLAVQLGCSREWVTKSLAALRRDGLIASEAGHAIRLLDPVKLHLIANAWSTVDGSREERTSEHRRSVN